MRRSTQSQYFSSSLFFSVPLPIFRKNPSTQLKYLEKGEFRDLKYVKTIKLDGNQLSVIIDNLFETQKNLEHLGNAKMRFMIKKIVIVHMNV